MGVIFLLLFLACIGISVFLIPFLRRRGELWRSHSNVPNWVRLAAWMAPSISVIALIVTFFPSGESDVHPINERDMVILFVISIALGLSPLFVVVLHDLFVFAFKYLNKDLNE